MLLNRVVFNVEINFSKMPLKNTKQTVNKSSILNNMSLNPNLGLALKSYYKLQILFN